MQAGDRVVVKADPFRYGAGTVVGPTGSGAILVSFTDEEWEERKTFRPHDLEMLDRAPLVLSDADLDGLRRAA